MTGWPISQDMALGNSNNLFSTSARNWEVAVSVISMVCQCAIFMVIKFH